MPAAHFTMSSEPEKNRQEPPAPDEHHAELVARLFREHNEALISFLALRLNSLQDAKEVAQESYVRLLQLDRPGAASLLSAYLFRIASNLAVDRLRHRTVRWRSALAVKAEFFDVLLPDEPERRVLAGDELEFIRRCLDELPPDCRRAFWLHRIDELSVLQIAHELGVTERMVRYHLGRALIYCQLRLRGATPAQARERLKP
jgi:RNA polymerase sigma factor (sigma-70 family)